jgi:hypothetical protein
VCVSREGHDKKTVFHNFRNEHSFRVRYKCKVIFLQFRSVSRKLKRKQCSNGNRLQFLHNYVRGHSQIECLMLISEIHRGRVMAQTVSRRPHAAETRVHALISPCGICGGPSGTGTPPHPEFFGFPLSVSFHRGLLYSSITWRMMGPVDGRSSETHSRPSTVFLNTCSQTGIR